MITNYDFTNYEDRVKAFADLNEHCKADFIKAGFEAAPESNFELTRASLTIRFFDTDIYLESSFSFFSENKVAEHKINFGTSGAFTPDNNASYWRIIQAASILKLWDILCPIADEYCRQHRELEKEVISANKHVEAAD